MPELALRLNTDTWEAELVVDNEVAMSTGNDVFESWVEAWNEEHGYVHESTIDVDNSHTEEESPVEEETSTDVDNTDEDEVESIEDDDTVGEEEFLSNNESGDDSAGESDTYVEIPDQDV